MRAVIAELEALKLHHDLQAEVLKAERDAATARVAELERPNWLTTPTRSTRSRAERLKEALAREEALLARVAELEASEPNVLLQRAYLLACNERNEMLEREAAHLAHIKALMAKRVEDMREVARWGAELAFNVDDHVDDTKIAADIMAEFATFDADDELLQRLAHYNAEGGEG
jgi:hypothetical protein